MARRFARHKGQVRAGALVTSANTQSLRSSLVSRASLLKEGGKFTEIKAMTFDWHSDPITRATEVTPGYRTTQNVRRFLTGECGRQVWLDRPFMSWIKNGSDKTMGDVVDEWIRRNPLR